MKPIGWVAEDVSRGQVDAWDRHWRELISTGRQGRWVRFRDGDRPDEFMLAVLRTEGATPHGDKPLEWLDWPCGRFVRYASGRVVLALVSFCPTSIVHRGMFLVQEAVA